MKYRYFIMLGIVALVVGVISLFIGARLGFGRETIYTNALVSCFSCWIILNQWFISKDKQ